jgi:4'-phosphopantetheinyl transferase EntD
MSRAFEVAFELDLAHGACVGVTLPDAADDDARLRPGERARAATLSPVRRVTWIGGRVALRAAAARAGIALDDVLVTPRGAPALPAHLAGSISHKEGIAIALVAPADGAARGVDVEIERPQKIDIAKKVLRPEEIAEIDAQPDRARAVLLRFSMKESIYKALDPFVGRYVAFREARVSPRADGTVDAALFLDGDDGPFDVDVRWLERDDLLITSARIARVPRER